jgi:muramoyltetrapeptide carboxypeptidase LdcA involved in peptidoglycan recycling
LEDLNVPVVYDVDLGHLPPQLTFINGAYAACSVKEGKGIIK